MTGIYFFKLKGVVIYVGKSKDAFGRVTQQKGNFNGMYDDIKFLPYPENELDEREKMWIKYLKPIDNVVHNREKVTVPKSNNGFTSSKRIIKIRRMMFRKLTKKSIVGFGGWKHLTIDHFFKHKRYIDLASMYYKLSHITFMDDVLDELKITAEWRIEKPGNNYEKFIEFITTVYPEESQKRLKVSRAKAAKRSLEVLKAETKRMKSKQGNMDSNRWAFRH